MTAARLAPAARLHVAGDGSSGGQDGLAKRFGDVSTQLIALGTVALVGTSIRVWAGMDVIQTQITALVKSDANQDQRIEQIRTEINTLRVQVGVLRAITDAK